MAQKFLLSSYWLRRQRQALDLTQNYRALHAGDLRATIATVEIVERRTPHQLAKLLATHLAIVSEERGTFPMARRTPTMPLVGCCWLREVQYPC